MNKDIKIDIDKDIEIDWKTEKNDIVEQPRRVKGNLIRDNLEDSDFINEITRIVDEKLNNNSKKDKNVEIVKVVYEVKPSKVEENGDELKDFDKKRAEKIKRTVQAIKSNLRENQQEEERKEEERKKVLEELSKKRSELVKKFVQEFKNSKKENAEEESKKILTSRFKFGRRIKAEVRHWKRRLRKPDDSIKNKQYKPRKKSLKKYIKGAVTVLAVGGLALSSLNIANNRNKPETKNLSNADYVVTNTLESEKPESDSTSTQAKSKTSTMTKTPSQSQTEIKPAGEKKKDDAIKIDEKKLNKFKDWATEKYKSQIVIGEELKIASLFKDQQYSQNPDGTGRKGNFNSFKNISISFINIITPDEWKIVKTDGNNLQELLNKYPDCVEYSIHFTDVDSGCALGFVTNNQLETLVENNIDSLINSKKGNIVEHNKDNNELEMYSNER